MNNTNKWKRNHCHEFVVSSVHDILSPLGYGKSNISFIYDKTTRRSGYGFKMFILEKVWRLPCPGSTTVMFCDSSKSYWVRVGKHYAQFNKYTNSKLLVDFVLRYTWKSLDSE